MRLPAFTTLAAVFFLSACQDGEAGPSIIIAFDDALLLECESLWRSSPLAYPTEPVTEAHFRGPGVLTRHAGDWVAYTNGDDGMITVRVLTDREMCELEVAPNGVPRSVLARLPEAGNP